MESRCAGRFVCALVLLFCHGTNQLFCPHKLITAIENVKSDITHAFPDCTTIDIVLDVISLMTIELGLERYHMDILETRETRDELPLTTRLTQWRSSVTLVIDFEQGNNLSFIVRFPSRYRIPCSFVTSSFDVSTDLHSGTFIAERLLLTVPSTVHRTFVIFFRSTGISGESLSYISKSLVLLQHAAFLLWTEENIILFKASAVKNMTVVGSHDAMGELIVEGHLFGFLEENFEGHTLYGLTCPVCEPNVEIYQRLGFWDNFVYGAMYTMCLMFNATLAVDPVFGVPGDGRTEDGGWDDFVGPLVDGSAVFSTMVKPNIFVEQVVYLSMPYMYDAVTFTVGPPTLTSFEGLSILEEPLQLQVWIAFLLSLVGIFTCLETFVYLRGLKQRHAKVLTVLLQPVVDQLALTSGFAKTTKEGYVNVLVGLWLLSLIVVSCAYKSHLISAIMVPKYSFPPQTFSELVASDYEIGGIFYTNFIENDLAAANTSVSREIMRRVAEYDYLDPLCYQTIFEKNFACLGYGMAFDGIGIEFMVDIHGRKMYSSSRDSHFDGLMVVGISKFHPVVLEGFNYILSLLESTGISMHSRKYGLGRLVKKGQMYAKNQVASKKFYVGISPYREAVQDRRTAFLLLQILSLGNIIAFTVFISEACTGLRWGKINQRISYGHDMVIITYVSPAVCKEYQTYSNAEGVQMAEIQSKQLIDGSKKPLFKDFSYFNGVSMLVLTCTTCTPTQELLERIGVWSSLMFGGIYETLIRLKPTMETEEIFGIPRNGCKKDGTSDDFLPL